MKFLYRPFQPTLTPTGLGQLGLVMQSKRPCDALTGVVNAYLQITAQGPTPYPVMPDGTQAVYMSHQGLMIGGALTEARKLQLLGPGDYFGIWFRPAALRHLFSLNLSDITDQFVDEKYFQCAGLSRLHEIIYKYQAFSDRVNECENWLLERYSPHVAARFDHALSLVYQSLGNDRVEKIANEVGWSSRQLNRQFLQHTGLSTKAFLQIIRLQHIGNQLYLKPKQAPTGSVDHGYYDQAHLIKAFKKHFKSSPGKFLNHLMSDFYNQ